MARGTFSSPEQMDKIPPGSKIAPKAFIIIYYAELGKPYVFLAQQGIDPARERNDAEGRGMDKKRKALRNETHRGSKFALTRKGADLSNGIS